MVTGAAVAIFFAIFHRLSSASFSACGTRQGDAGTRPVLRATTLVFRIRTDRVKLLWDVKKPAPFKVPARSDVVRPVVRSILSALLRRGPALAARC